MIRSRDFFVPKHANTFYTNKSGTLTDITEVSPHLITITMNQVHGSDFAFITDIPPKNHIPKTDGILTNNPNILLTVRTADCLPILLYHPSGIVGAIHAGRKSTQKGILKKVLAFLKEEKSITEGISLWFGPAICEDCYQIDRQTDTHFNLIAENMAQAYSVFNAEDISLTVDSDCTECLSDEYHSYRVEHEAVCMNFAAIALKTL